MERDARAEPQATGAFGAMFLALVVVVVVAGNYRLASTRGEGRLQWVLVAATDLGLGERIESGNVRWSLRRAEGSPTDQDRWLGRVTASRIFAGRPLTDANTRSVSALATRPGRVTLWVSLVEGSGRMLLPGYRVRLAPDTTDERSVQVGDGGRGLLVLAVDTLPSPSSIQVELDPLDEEARVDLLAGEWRPLVIGDDWSTGVSMRGR